MDPQNLKRLLELLNQWLEEEYIEEEMLLSKVVLIFKKGDSANLENYRPISLLNSFYKIFAALIQKRLANTLDPYLLKTQYGFRKNKSTSDAIHCIRRAMEYGERTGNKEILVLLDWEKAFDKITHEALHQAMARMNVHIKYRNIIKQIYKNPKFYITMEGQKSKEMQQGTGIKQGCPLSPYLFIIVMTVLMHDVKSNIELKRNLIENRIPAAEFDEILYADDTILISTNPATINKYIKEIQLEGKNRTRT